MLLWFLGQGDLGDDIIWAQETSVVFYKSIFNNSLTPQRKLFEAFHAMGQFYTLRTPPTTVSGMMKAFFKSLKINP